MLKTLQWYIARELFKTFALTALGLTLVFSLCGLLMNMVRAEVLTAMQVGKLVAYMLPVSATFTLPVSALFACAIVYGRFAADNEFDACKASGINIHRLLAPAMGLSIVTAVFTFGFANYLIPHLIGQVEGMVKSDMQKVVTQALASQGFIKYGPYVLHARQAWSDEPAPNVKRLGIKDAAFLMIEKDVLTRCGTADRVFVEFRPGIDPDMPIVEAVMQDVVALDLTHNQLHQQSEQPFTPMQIPRQLDQDPKYLNLSALVHYVHKPTDFSKLQSALTKVRWLVRDAIFYRHSVAELNAGPKLLRLQDDTRQYEIRGEQIESSADDFRPTIHNAVIVAHWDKNQKREYKAERCCLRVKRGFSGSVDQVHISLSGRVSFVDALEPGEVKEPKQVELEDVPLPNWVLAEEKKITDSDLLGISEADFAHTRYDRLYTRDPAPMAMGTRVANARKSLVGDVALFGMEIAGLNHSRLAFSASVLVMLVLAAGLAIIFRGGQFLTAFAISLVPGLLVIMLNVTGRQLAEKAPSYLAGIAIIWAGIGLLAIADLVVLTRYLRR